ncbi:hypothetical protein VP01_7806g1, partial [Puccinia sorghi]
ITFGGHPHPQASTITFFLPIPNDSKPSILWKCDIKMGYVKTNMSASRTCHPHHCTLLRDLLPPPLPNKSTTSYHDVPLQTLRLNSQPAGLLHPTLLPSHRPTPP